MVSKNSDEILRFACPFCYAIYDIPEKELSKDNLLCSHCSTPLIMQIDRPSDSMKCLDCILAIEVPDGIWCLKFKGLASEEMAISCGDFLARDILGEDYEG